MGVPTSEVGYTPAMPRMEDHEVHKEHVVALEEEKKITTICQPNLVEPTVPEKKKLGPFVVVALFVKDYKRKSPVCAGLEYFQLLPRWDYASICSGIMFRNNYISVE